MEPPRPCGRADRSSSITVWAEDAAWTGRTAGHYRTSAVTRREKRSKEGWEEWCDYGLSDSGVSAAA